MTSREFYLERRRAENPVFLRLIKALPPDRVDYRPHERSPSAEQIMWTMTWELRSCLTVVTQNRSEWTPEPPPPFAEMLPLFEQWLSELVEQVEKIDDVSWDRLAQFYVKGKVVNEMPVDSFYGIYCSMPSIIEVNSQRTCDRWEARCHLSTVRRRIVAAVRPPLEWAPLRP